MTTSNYKHVLHYMDTLVEVFLAKLRTYIKYSE